MEIITRSQSIQQNLPSYFTGKVCKHGHIAERITSSGQCVDCLQRLRKQSYEKNKDKHLQRVHLWQTNNYQQMRETNKQYQITHKDEVSAYNKIRYGNKRDEILAAGRIWKKHNPHQIVKHNRLRQLKIHQAIPPWFEHDLVRQLYLKRDELNRNLGLQLEVDHIIPLNPQDGSVCGLHCWANLQLLDKSLNAHKYDTYETNW